MNFHTVSPPHLHNMYFPNLVLKHEIWYYMIVDLVLFDLQGLATLCQTVST